MLDRYNRTIDYMRVAVTDRCNLRCTYCMPPEGVALGTHGDILSYEQIEAIVRVAVELGIRKIRLTGGEPLVRKGIEDLVAMLSAIPGLDELCMTTNGTRLKELASKLQSAGLNRVNISLDTLDADKYREITRGGCIDEAMAGIDAAIACELGPIKINMVVFPDTSLQEIDDMRSYCEGNGTTLQLISKFSLHDRNQDPGPVPTERPPKCAACNRLRLTADGHLKPCLFSEDEIPVNFEDIRASLLAAVNGKPLNGTQCRTRLMHAIGG
jgi:cyclic pyranopterin phosphate synthase